MVQKNLISIVLLIAMGIFAFLYFTKETVIINSGEAEIIKLKTEINNLEHIYNIEIKDLQDSIAHEIYVRDSIIKQKNINYWYLKKKHEKEMADIMAMPIDSIYKLFTRLATD